MFRHITVEEGTRTLRRIPERRPRAGRCGPASGWSSEAGVFYIALRRGEIRGFGQPVYSALGSTSTLTPRTPGTSLTTLSISWTISISADVAILALTCAMPL